MSQPEWQNPANFQQPNFQQPNFQQPSNQAAAPQQWNQQPVQAAHQQFQQPTGFQPQTQQPPVQFQPQQQFAQPQQMQQPVQQQQPVANNPMMPQQPLQVGKDDIPPFLRPEPTPEEQQVAAQAPESYVKLGDEPRAVAGVSTNPWEEILANFPDGRYSGVVSCGGANMLIGRLRENMIMAEATDAESFSPVKPEDIWAALNNGGLVSVYWKPGYPDALFNPQAQVTQQQPVQTQQQPVQQVQQVQQQPSPQFQPQQAPAQQADPVGQAVVEAASPAWGNPTGAPVKEAEPEPTKEPAGKATKVTVGKAVAEKAERRVASKNVSTKIRAVLDRIMELELELAHERVKLDAAVRNDE